MLSSKGKWVIALLGLTLVTTGAYGQSRGNTPPDLTVCEGVEPCDAPSSVCDASGFTVTLTDYTPAPSQNSGSASYTYTVCAPAFDGTCSNTDSTCQDHQDCWKNRCRTGGPNANTCTHDGPDCSTDKDCNPEVICRGECRVDKFQDLSHADIDFPDIGEVEGCLGQGTVVTVSCSSPGVNDGTPYAGTIGDGSCFGPMASVAKCDNPNLGPGQCLTMTVSIPGELNKPGLGAAIVVDKEGTSCTSSCIQGPSCEPCVKPPDGDKCLTRTLGFWGTHPWITNDYDPVTICGNTLGCSGADDGKSNPSCKAGSCDSIMEGLGSIPSELPSNQPYVAMVKQLTAAKLNLNATAALFGTACSSFRFQNMTIAEWIAACEDLCAADKSTISNSGCIEALNAFNNSQDTGFDVTPSPFDRPPVDDKGNISGADPSQFTAAQGNKNPPGKWVIGKKVGNNDCRPQP